MRVEKINRRPKSGRFYLRALSAVSIGRLFVLFARHVAFLTHKRAHGAWRKCRAFIKRFFGVLTTTTSANFNYILEENERSRKREARARFCLNVSVALVIFDRPAMVFKTSDAVKLDEELGSTTMKTGDLLRLCHDHSRRFREATANRTIMSVGGVYKRSPAHKPLFAGRRSRCKRGQRLHVARFQSLHSLCRRRRRTLAHIEKADDCENSKNDRGCCRARRRDGYERGLFV